MSQKHLLYITQYLGIPHQSRFTTRPWDFAQLMAKENYKVSVICSTAGFKEPPAPSPHPNITIYWIEQDYENQLGIFARLLAFLGFFIKAIYKQFSIHHVDCIYASSTPLSTGVLGWMVSKIRSIPWVFEIRDLWPDFPVQLGLVKHPLLKKILYSLETGLYRDASSVIVLSETAYEKVHEKGISREKIVLAHNGYSLDASHAVTSKQPTLTLCYAGTLGYANNLPWIFDVFDRVQRYIPSAQLIIAGEGKMRAFVESNVANSQNAHYFGKLSQSQALELMGRAHFNLIPFLDLEVLDANSPHKFFDGLALGCLPVTNVKGWLKTLIEYEHVGIASKDPEQVAHYITSTYSDTHLMNEKIKLCKTIALNFNRALIFENVNKMLKNVLNLEPVN